MSSRIWTLALAVAMFCLSPATSLARDGKPPTPDVELAGEGLVLFYPKWDRAGWGKNVGLSVTYTFGGTSWRVEGRDGGSRWQISVAARPQPNEKVQVEATYRFETDPKLLNSEADKVITATIDELVEALRAGVPGGGGEEKYYDVFAKAWAAGGHLSSATAVLDQHHTTSGTRATALLLVALGFAERARVGWVPKTDENGTLVGDWSALNDAQVALNQFDSNLLDDYEREIVAFAGGGCYPDYEAARNASSDIQKLVDAVHRCAIVTCPTPATADCRAVEAALSPFATSDELVISNRIQDPMTATALWEAASKDTELRNQAFATLWASSRVAVIMSEAIVRAVVVKAFENALKAGIWRSDTLTAEMVGAVLLAANAGKRLYDVTTGFVYVERLDNISMPLLISLCPFGCRPPRETIWSSWHALSQSFSIDIGVRAATVMGPSRRGGDTALLLGASISPFPLLRFAGGAMVFADPNEDDKLRYDLYWGLTFDLITAAELFGATGFRIPEPPTVEPQ